VGLLSAASTSSPDTSHMKPRSIQIASAAEQHTRSGLFRPLAR
jgi:hypothetical protein